MKLGNLPVEVLEKVASYTHGKPEYIKIKHSEALKNIQNKYKIERLGPKINRKRKHGRTKAFFCEHCIMRDVPFSVNSIYDIITNEKEELLSLIYEEIEDKTEFDTTLEIELKLVARLPDKEYEENIFDTRDVDFNYEFDEDVNEYNLSIVLQQAGEDIYEYEIEEDPDKASIIGVQFFTFKLSIFP